MMLVIRRRRNHFLLSSFPPSLSGQYHLDCCCFVATAQTRFGRPKASALVSPPFLCQAAGLPRMHPGIALDEPCRPSTCCSVACQNGWKPKVTHLDSSSLAAAEVPRGSVEAWSASQAS
jgi:hypothetical protein